MPHTTRRKKPQYESKKLVNIPAGDGWSTVSRKVASSAHNSTLRDTTTQDASATGTQSHPPTRSSSNGDHGPPTHRRVLHGRPSLLLEHLTHDQALALYENPNNPHHLLPHIKPPDYTQERVAVDFTSRLKSYRESHDAELVRHILTNRYEKERLRGLTKAIIVGSGSLSVADFQRGPLWQVAAFVFMCEVIAEVKGVKAQEVSNWQKLSRTSSGVSLAKALLDSEAEKQAEQEEPQHGHALQIYAQEPVYNSFDKAFLKYLGIKVLESPAGFDLIDEHTMVFAPHFGVNTWPVCMRDGAAGLTIGNNVESSLDSVAPRQEIIEYFREWLGRYGGVKSEDDIPDVNIRWQLEEFLRRHTVVQWPNMEERCHASFNNLAIYWKEIDEP